MERVRARTDVPPATPFFEVFSFFYRLADGEGRLSLWSPFPLLCFHLPYFPMYLPALPVRRFQIVVDGTTGILSVAVKSAHFSALFCLALPELALPIFQTRELTFFFLLKGRDPPGFLEHPFSDSSFLFILSNTRVL